MMKSRILNTVILIFSFSLLLFLLSSCKNKEIGAPGGVNFEENGQKLPEFTLNGKDIDHNEFRYENIDGYLYVYDGCLFFTEDAPDAFETVLNVYYKGDDKICRSINVTKRKIYAESISVECEQKYIFPGEEVKFKINTVPEDASLDGISVVFDKEEYVILREDNSFILKTVTPLNEKLRMNFTLGNGVSTEYEFKVAERIFDIDSPEKMELLRIQPNGYFRLTSDIDMSKSNWTPVSEFRGLLDGNGHSVTGIKLRSTQESSSGLLFLENHGIIKDLALCNSVLKFATTNMTSEYFLIEDTVLIAGGICGVNHGRLENLTVKDLEMTELRLGSLKRRHNFNIFAGAICGINYGQITKCGAIDNSITAYASSLYERAYVALGGIVGENSENLEYSYSYGNSLTSYLYGINTEGVGVSRLYNISGGLVGQSKGEITECVCGKNEILSYSEGSNDKYTKSYNGSFLGLLHGGSIKRSYALYDTLPVISNSNAHLVATVTSLSLFGCPKLTKNIWIEKDDRVIIKYDWMNPRDE